MIVEHHTHYEEIHGFDRTVWIEKGAHKALHNRLRKEGKCNIPVDELSKISQKASYRTDKAINYRDSDKRKQCCKKYDNSKKGRTKKKEWYQTVAGKKSLQNNRIYELKNMQFINFLESFGVNTLLHERISYNYKTGNISYFGVFEGSNKFKLPIIDI